MVAPLVWAGIALGSLYLGGKAISDAGQAAESATKLAKWSVAGGALYVSYRALKAGGVLK
ncbi:hypothetical protein [Epibacterium sp. Ofav1-8]|uniref:hypothetical protein n=1 Tax=Epibacterium sp. Ofav1-8 TaxID=2917735 RepID=UPI001EF4A20B|nr:hypothetical protein [Epibacterium sp. Ofav1-8]MCG7622733.1 hypothetical protein [Epibacterium sp. Ofav1-8]